MRVLRDLKNHSICLQLKEKHNYLVIVAENKGGRGQIINMAGIIDIAEYEKIILAADLHRFTRILKNQLFV